jgi:hypothetical protein
MAHKTTIGHPTVRWRPMAAAPANIQHAETKTRNHTGFSGLPGLEVTQSNIRISPSPACPHSQDYFAASYFLGRGGISEMSTGSNSNFGSSASGAKYALVVFRKFLSSRSGKSGL